jgi:hypothetical protein
VPKNKEKGHSQLTDSQSFGTFAIVGKQGLTSFEGITPSLFFCT